MLLLDVVGDVELQIALRGLLPADVEDGEVCQVGHPGDGGTPFGDGVTVGDDDHVAPLHAYIWYEAQMRACFFEGFWFLFVIFASETINCT